MPHMAPFMWLFAPALVGGMIYGLIITSSSPVMFKGAMLPSPPKNYWSWI